MDAFASILRPLSPYGPDQRGLPPYPRFPALRCCGSSVRRGIRCCGLGGQGAWQPSLRSGRLRRPARAEWDNSRRRTPCPHCLVLTSWSSGSLLVVHAYLVCVRLLGWTGALSTSQQTLSVFEGGRRSDCMAPFLRGCWSSVSCLCGCSGLRTISAQVGTFLPQPSFIPPYRPPPSTHWHWYGCPLLLVDSCAVHVSTDTGVIEQKSDHYFDTFYPQFQCRIYGLNLL